MVIEPDLLQTIESPPTASAISWHSLLVELSIQMGDVSRVRQGAICVDRLALYLNYYYLASGHLGNRAVLLASS